MRALMRMAWMSECTLPRSKRIHGLKSQLVIALVPLFAACSKGGQLSLEAGARRLTPTSVGPLVQVNQGGKALVVEQGKTPDTGVHGWVTIQAVQSRSISSTSGGLTGTTNKASSVKK